MKKKVIAIGLVLAFTLSACNKGTDTEGTPTSSMTPTTGAKIESTVGPTIQTTPTITPTTEPTATPLSIKKEDYPKVDGSTSTLPLSQAVYQTLTGASESEAMETIKHYKTTNSYIRLIDKEVDLLIVAEANQKVYDHIKETGVKITMKPIALDAFVFLCNESNPVTSLTPEQIVNIYSGKTTNWSELGGNNQSIIAFQRNENAGSQTMMKSLVMKDVPMMNAPSFEIATMSDLVDKVADYNNEANAIGYSVFYYANLMYQQPGLRFMAINNIEPTAKTIQDNSYPFITTYYAVIREDEDVNSSAHQVFDWLTTNQAQELATSLGYVSVTPGESGQNQEGIPLGKLIDKELPIQDDERIIISPKEYTIQLLDKSLNVTNTFNNTMTLSDMEEEYDPCYPKQSNICNINEPLILKAGYQQEGQTDEQVSYGLYDLKENKWIIPYKPGLITKVTDGVYRLDNQLIDSKGTILFESNADFIVNGSNIYVANREDVITKEQTKYNVIEKGEDYCYYDRTSTTGKYILSDKAVYTSDNQLCVDVDKFIQANNIKNADSEQFYVNEVEEDSKKVLVIYRSNYYRIDFTGKILENLGEPECYIGEGEFYTINKNTIRIRNILTSHVREITLPNTIEQENTYFDIRKVGYGWIDSNYYWIAMNNESTGEAHSYLGDGTVLIECPLTASVYENGYIETVQEENGVTTIQIYNPEGNKRYEVKGSSLSIPYVTESLMTKCSGDDNASYLTIEGYDGTVYYRSLKLGEDE